MPVTSAVAHRSRKVIMKTMLMLAIVVILAAAASGPAAAGPAAAHDLGHRAPAKPAGVHQPPPVDPGVLRQGGDTIADAVPIAIPYDGAGTTVGYTHDYEETCPYVDSPSPDVVYTTTPAADMLVDIDLLGSSYDTKVYVYDEALNLVACNDDFYPDFTSKLERVALQGGAPYYVVVDGFGGDAGAYAIAVDESEPCEVACPAGGELEGEPPLVDDYADAFNGGCNSPGFGTPFDTIPTDAPFCGVTGWYQNGGVETRDTDWFEITIDDDGFVEIAGDAEFETHLYELGPTDCSEVAIVQSVTIGPCAEDYLVVTGAPGSTAWVWVGPPTFTGPVNEYAYLLRITDVTATEQQSWSAVKGLFE